MRTITVSNLKGGSGKTTSAAFLAHSFAAQGKNVLVVDADPQESALQWSEDGEWAIPTIALPVRNLHTRLAGIVQPSTDIVIIDTPPLREHEQMAIVYSALRAADTIVVPVAPTMMEFKQLRKVWEAIAEVEPLRNTPPAVAVLLNRVVTNANSTEVFREQITAAGHHVLRVAIPRRESIAQADGSPITDTDAYAYVADELDALNTGSAA